MRSENITYYINFIRGQTSTRFNGNNEECSRFIEENLQRTVAMMDKYTENGNPWWLNNDANMAYHQLKEFDTLIVDYPIFIDSLSRLLNRPIQSFEIGKNYSTLIQEANSAYTNYMREKIMHRYTEKPHEQQILM